MIYRFEDVELDMGRFELRRGGEVVATEPQVLELLELLIRNTPRMVSREELNAQIWAGRVVSDAAISSRIKSARQAIGDDGKAQRLIQTVHGKGFRFVGKLIADTAPGVSEAVQADTSAAAPVTTPESAHTRPVVAVLPFLNLSGDPEQEYFSDAIAQDIITSLSRHRWLHVIARNTSFGYKGKAPDPRRLREEIGADYVVEGSVRRAGQRIRVSASLAEASSGVHKWGERYDRDLEDIFAVQDEITNTIVARLEPEIGFAERQRVARLPRAGLQAWDCYHLGISHFFRFTAQDNLEAQRLLQQSRELDPGFGEAHAWWAYAVVLGMVYWDTEPEPELLDAALAATRHALEIDDQNAIFYALKARVQLARGEYDSALVENEMAIRLNPSLAAAYCGLADTLAYQGHYEDAVERFAMAIELSPNDPQRWAFLTYGALALIFKGDFEAAVSWCERAGVIPNCQYWTLAHKAVALAWLGHKSEAEHTAAQLLASQPGFSRRFAREKLFYIKDPEQLQRYIDGLQKAGIPAG